MNQKPDVVIILAQKDDCFVVLQRKRDGKWMFPGGKIDPDETYRDAAIREMYEETGLHIGNLRLLGKTYERGKDMYFLCADITGGSLTIREPEKHFEVCLKKPIEICRLPEFDTHNYAFDVLADAFRRELNSIPQPGRSPS